MVHAAELVFHVLAHVRDTAGLAPSVFDPAWVAFVERHAGPSTERTLAEDARVIGRAATTHEALAEVQLLAWLFDDAARMAACADRNLDALSAADVDDPGLLPLLVESARRAAIEVLRAAAELEAEVYAALPPARHDPRALSAARARVERASPELRGCVVETVRPLRLRGRVRGARIWVGSPCDDEGPTAEHVAWQAAHEATVAEVHARAREAGVPVAHAPLEHAALVLLAERAARVSEGAAHARWLAHLRGLPAIDRAALDERWRAVVERSLRRD
ncbi:MAG: hypothetical protein HYV09_30025 [Deltaproteobacteria bacterium]|nr:hypothetical protein [Deltaproteobacteria bacterium]